VLIDADKPVAEALPAPHWMVFVIESAALNPAAVA
jgi:hypothetical protein